MRHARDGRGAPRSGASSKRGDARSRAGGEPAPDVVAARARQRPALVLGGALPTASAPEGQPVVRPAAVRGRRAVARASWRSRSTPASIPPAAWRYSEETASAVLSAIVSAMVGLTGFVVAFGVLWCRWRRRRCRPGSCGSGTATRCSGRCSASSSGTLTFALALLRGVGPRSVPDVGVTVAALAVTVSVVLFLAYLDRFVHSLRPVAVAWAVAECRRARVPGRASCRSRRRGRRARRRAGLHGRQRGGGGDPGGRPRSGCVARRPVTTA